MQASHPLRVVLIVMLAITLLGSLPFLQTWLKAGDYYGYYSPTPVPVIPGAPAPQGGLNVVFFGFGSCTRVCPTQLANLLELQPYVDPKKVRFVYVSLDADIQDQEELDSVFRAWGPSFRAVVPGTVSIAQKLASDYGGFASDRGIRTSRSERFNHDGRLYVVNDDNLKVLTYPSPALDIERVADDLLQLTPDFALPSGVDTNVRER